MDVRALAIDRGAPTNRPGRRRQLFSRYLVPGALIVSAMGLLWWSFAQVLTPTVAVTVMPVRAQDAAMVAAGETLFKAAGWIEPRPTAIRVAALQDGTVARLLVVEDQYVEAGEPVAYLVDQDAKLALRMSTAELANRQAEYLQAESALQAAQTNFQEPSVLQALLAEANADLGRIETEFALLPVQLRQAKARLELTQTEQESKRRSGDAVAQLALAQAENAVAVAQAQVEELEQKAPLLRRQRDAVQSKQQAYARQLELKTEVTRALAEGQAKLQAAEANRQLAQANVDKARLTVERTTVRAPVTGRVLKLIAPPGAHLAGPAHEPGTDGATVVTMYQPQQLQVRADVRFEDLPKIGRGQPVEVRSPAHRRPLIGSVLFLSSVANIQKNTLEVKIALEQPPEVLKPEMLVEVSFQRQPDADINATAESQRRIFVPAALLSTSGDQHRLWIVDPASGRAKSTAVQVGAKVGPWVEVTTGLDLTSRLLVVGRERLTEGAAITVTGEDDSLNLPIDDDTSAEKHRDQHRLAP